MKATLESFTSAGAGFDTLIFRPSTPSGAAIVMAHGADGAVDNENGPWLTMMTEYAMACAEKGVVVSMPHYFGREGVVNFLELRTYQRTLTDALVHLQGLPGVDPLRVGWLGFSLGGHLVLRNRSGVKALAAFFAPLLREVGGIGATASHGLPVQIHHGKDDGLVDFDTNAVPIVQQLRKEGAVVELCDYENAGHGFNGRHPGDAVAHRDAKAKTVAFFEQAL